MVPNYYNIIHMNTNTNNHKTSYSITRGLFFLIMCSVIFTVLYYSLPRQNREPAISDYIDFSEGWTTSDGSPVYYAERKERIFESVPSFMSILRNQNQRTAHLPDLVMFS